MNITQYYYFPFKTIIFIYYYEKIWKTPIIHFQRVHGTYYLVIYLYSFTHLFTHTPTTIHTYLWFFDIFCCCCFFIIFSIFFLVSTTILTIAMYCDTYSNNSFILDRLSLQFYVTINKIIFFYIITLYVWEY